MGTMLVMITRISSKHNENDIKKRYYDISVYVL